MPVYKVTGTIEIPYTVYVEAQDEDEATEIVYRQDAASLWWKRTRGGSIEEASVQGEATATPDLDSRN